MPEREGGRGPGTGGAGDRGDRGEGGGAERGGGAVERGRGGVARAGDGFLPGGQPRRADRGGERRGWKRRSEAAGFQRARDAGSAGQNAAGPEVQSPVLLGRVSRARELALIPRLPETGHPPP